MRVRGIVEAHDGVPDFLVGVAWLRDCPLMVGDQAHVEIAPEGPQRTDLAEDVATAPEASPKAGQFFDSPEFYRRAYLRWDRRHHAPTRPPTGRIATMVELLERGVKDYRSR